MNGLTPEDWAFLLKGSKSLKGRMAWGWVLLGLPWLLGFLVVVDSGAVIRLPERVSQEVCQPLERGLDEQNANPKALQTATALEAALV